MPHDFIKRLRRTIRRALLADRKKPRDLIAVRDLIHQVGHVEIPVYLCDSIVTPVEYGQAHQEEMFGKPMKLPTGAQPTPFLIPRRVAGDHALVAKYTNLLAEMAPVRSGFSPADFLERVKEEGLSLEEKDDHLKLFEDLRELDKANKNGVWARIIKNAFAPLFAGTFDFIAGNPPWVNWNNLPSEVDPKSWTGGGREIKRAQEKSRAVQCGWLGPCRIGC